MCLGARQGSSGVHPPFLNGCNYVHTHAKCYKSQPKHFRMHGETSTNILQLIFVVRARKINNSSEHFQMIYIFILFRIRFKEI